jgi:DNA-binding winged helix-turn-helix (wHTH) protein
MNNGAMRKPDGQSAKVLSFGQFRLVASERLLSKDGAPVKLSAGAMDIPIALTTRPSDVVSKRDLLAEVWPDTIVVEGSLRFHITHLRKALGDGVDDARYIVNSAGRSYCFVAPLTPSGASPTGDPAPDTNLAHASLPGPVTKVIGRADEVLLISKELAQERFVTIVGPGGIGKTTVAIAVGHKLAASFDNAVVFIGIGTTSESATIAASIASMLGLVVETEHALSGPKFAERARVGC